MRSPFRYPGAKGGKAAPLILSQAPRDYDEYREPFVGGGSIYFAHDQRKHRWINDIDPDLILSLPGTKRPF